ncbi:class II glutamine amidotransferase [uncultured Ruminococcus sp.]|uniref:class II glutamine amidotransferase n=1 Tax=uncultured Ruminococcus sp. TaxID=165186 RepID=UPI0025EC7410|nr:class II glutamine amidotransferase [uncultured Ruminococcus sp.]
MCSLFGFLDYQGIIPHKVLRKLTQSIAVAAEERGTDASGISYVKDGQIVIFKRPKPAHRLHFNLPEGTRAVLGHTRMTTQGSEKNNANNHPFYGKTGDTTFAFAHNGIIYNDKELRKEKQLPVTAIETDSYVAVQLIESQHHLDFESLRYMAEEVNGSFTFSLLDENNSLYLVKGSNPLCLLHFASLGLYVYSSTESIMKKAIKRIGLDKFASERIEADEGDIIKIDKNGNITRSQFTPAPSYTYYSRGKWWCGDYEDYFSTYEETLIEMAHLFGADENDVILLLDYGYTADEIADLMMDTDMFQETIKELKLMEGECVYDNYCYGGVF